MLKSTYFDDVRDSFVAHALYECVNGVVEAWNQEWDLGKSSDIIRTELLLLFLNKTNVVLCWFIGYATGTEIGLIQKYISLVSAA